MTPSVESREHNSLNLAQFDKGLNELKPLLLPQGFIILSQFLPPITMTTHMPWQWLGTLSEELAPVGMRIEGLPPAQWFILRDILCGLFFFEGLSWHTIPTTIKGKFPEAYSPSIILAVQDVHGSFHIFSILGTARYDNHINPIHPLEETWSFRLLCWANLIDKKIMGFPDDPVVKNPPCNAWDTSLIPDLWRSHMPQSN